MIQWSSGPSHCEAWLGGRLPGFLSSIPFWRRYRTRSILRATAGGLRAGAKRGQILKLLKTCYALTDGPAAWYRHIFKLLAEQLGYRQSVVGPCLFYFWLMVLW